MERPDPVNRCPDPGPGVQIGGDAGTGADTQASPQRRLVLMGGGPEEDEAARGFVEAANGGDIVILRATGSLTTYPRYFTVELSPNPMPATAVTVLTRSPEAGADPAVLCRVNRAEAVWIAGGDQWDYLGRWPEALHDSLVAATARGAAFGGTSAGAMSLGEGAFDAHHGTVTSDEALADPLRREVSVAPSGFARPELDGVLVDSHFTERSREGRLLAFLARFLAMRGTGPVVGVGLDEGVAIVIHDGGYRVTSNRNGAAWIYQVAGPALLMPGTPLTLEGVRRVRLPAGSSGDWPFGFDDSDAVVELRVEAGRVTLANPHHLPP